LTPGSILSRPRAAAPGAPGSRVPPVANVNRERCLRSARCLLERPPDGAPVGARRRGVRLPPGRPSLLAPILAHATEACTQLSGLATERLDRIVDGHRVELHSA